MFILQGINMGFKWSLNSSANKNPDFEVVSIWLTWIVLLFVVIKTMYCSRGYDKMQKLVYLVWGSFIGIMEFLFFFLYSILIFALLTLITKINKPGVDQPHDDDAFPDIDLLRSILYTFDNSIADLNHPEYSTHWDTDAGYTSPAMITLIFIQYYVQIVT